MVCFEHKEAFVCQLPQGKPHSTASKTLEPVLVYSVKIILLQPEGKHRLSARDFILASTSGYLCY